MKHLIRIWVFTLIFAQFGFAYSFLPFAKFHEDTSFRISLGGYTGLRAAPYEGLGLDDVGAGLSDLGGAIALSKLCFSILEIGIDAKMGSASLGRLFGTDPRYKNLSGFRIDTDLQLRLMIPLVLVDIGGFVGTGLGFGRSEYERETLNKEISPGWNVYGGPLVRLNLGLFGAYLGLAYTFRNIRFNTETFSQEWMRELVNQHGLHIPLGFVLYLGDHINLFAQFDTNFENFRARYASYKGGLNLGVSFSF